MRIRVIEATDRKKEAAEKTLDSQARISHFPPSSVFIEFLRLTENFFHFQMSKGLRLECIKLQHHFRKLIRARKRES